MISTISITDEGNSIDISDLLFPDDITIDISAFDTNLTNRPLVISRPGKPDISVAEKLDEHDNKLALIMERLAIIQSDFDKMEKYPALREAYNNYKLIEAMIINDHKNEK